MADVTQDPSETTDDAQPIAQEAAPEALGPTGDVADAAPESQSETAQDSASSSPEAGADSSDAETASPDGLAKAEAPADPTSGVDDVSTAAAPTESLTLQETGTEMAGNSPSLSQTPDIALTASQDALADALDTVDASVGPTDAQTSPDALPAPEEITEPESADAAPEATEAEGDTIVNPTPEQPSAPTADGDQDTASAPEAPAELPPEEGGLMPDAPTAKAPEHDEVHPDGSDRLDDAPMGVPAQDKNHRPTDGEPGDGPTHVGTDTPEFLVSNPCDPKTGRPLDGSGQPKGVIVGGSGSLNKAPDLTKTFGINNDQTMEEASAGLPEGYGDDEGDEPEGFDESSADSLDDGDDEPTEGTADKEALYQAIESKLNNVLEEIGDMLGL